MPFRERAGQGSVTDAVLLEKVRRFRIHVCGETCTPAVPEPQHRNSHQSLEPQSPCAVDAERGNLECGSFL